MPHEKVVAACDAPAHADLDRIRNNGPSVAQPPKVMVPPPTSAADLRQDDEQVVRLAEEQLNVGKRQVDAGTTRVHRFVVEKPVEADVTLHEEYVEVMRRVIHDPGELRDIDWTEQTIEVIETAEQPVVSKTVRVTEEVVIRRKSFDHTETIHDTLRRQQLAIEKTPAESPRSELTERDP